MRPWYKWGMAALLVASAAAAQAQSPSTVLVVANANNPESVELASYYMGKRGIPLQNRLLLNWQSADNADTIGLAAYNSTIAQPIYAKIATLPQIDYIVLCRNLPIKIADTGGSVDSALASKGTSKRFNPYFNHSTAFSSKTYGMYLVTRLDGWSWEDAHGLVDRGMSKAGTSKFVLDGDPARDRDPSYSGFNMAMMTAAQKLVAMHMPFQWDDTTAFLAPVDPVAGYISWGSNDSHFSAATFANLRFAPGAVAETLVSTSASNLRYPGGWQSQIATLIHSGVTGVKGYVAEPLCTATAYPWILFPNYARGMNLASSFYSASQYIGWRDVVVGDALCAPYSK